MKSSEPTSAQHRIDELDGLRGILAWWVVAGHLLRTLGWRFPPIVSPNRAVDVFIILSGFVIFMLLDRQRESYRAFIARRFFRLFPVWWVALSISILLIGVITSATANAPFDASVDRRLKLIAGCKEQLWPHVLIYVALLQGVVPHSLSTGAPWCYVGQAWSVSLEWQFYLLAPLVFVAFQRGHVILTAVALSLLTLLPGLGFEYSFVFNSGSFAYFATGIASYYLWRERERLIGVSAIIAVAMLLAVVVGSEPLFLWAVVFGSLLHRRLFYSKGLSRLLLGRVLQYLGKISYSTYLTHMIPIYVAMVVADRIGLAGTAYRGFLLVAVPPAIVLLSHVIHAGVEAPFIRYGRRFSRRSRGGQLSRQEPGRGG